MIRVILADDNPSIRFIVREYSQAEMKNMTSCSQYSKGVSHFSR